MTKGRSIYNIVPKTHGSWGSVMLYNSPVIGNLEVPPAKEAGIILLVRSHGSPHFYSKRMQSNSLKTLTKSQFLQTTTIALFATITQHPQGTRSNPYHYQVVLKLHKSGN